MIVRLTRALCALAFILLSSMPARADVFAIVPPWYQGTDGAKVAERIAKAIEADLSGQGKVLSQKQVLELVPPSQRVSCGEAECADQYRRAASATAAVVIRVYRFGDGAGPATSFQVGIQPQPGLEYAESIVLDGSAIEELAIRALREALRKYSRGVGPFLEVVGGPIGADIFVDDQHMGTLSREPRIFTVSVGTHRVRVEARDFDPKTMLVSLPSAASAERREFRLEPAKLKHLDTAPAYRFERKGPEPKRWPVAVLLGTGITALAGGTALSILALRARDPVSQCENSGPTPCREFYRFGSTERAELVTGLVLATLGGTAIATGSFLLVRNRRAKAVEISAEIAPHHAALRLTGGF